MSTVIGELHFDQGLGEMTAVLDEAMRWHCDDAEIEAFLNASYDANDDPLDVHRPLIHMLYQAAERLGAEVRLPSAPRRRLTCA